MAAKSERYDLNSDSFNPVFARIASFECKLKQCSNKLKQTGVINSIIDISFFMVRFQFIRYSR